MPRSIRPLTALAILLAPWIGLSPLGVNYASASFLKPGDIVVADISFNLYRVDPVTGDRTVLSGEERGDGPTLFAPFSVAQTSDGALMVVDIFGGRVMRVDPSTGDRTVVSQQDLSGDGFLPFDFSPEPVGEGPDFRPSPFSTALASPVIPLQGKFLVAAQNGLIRVDPVTGDRAFLSSPTVGDGPAFTGTQHALAQGTNDELYVSSSLGALFRVDPVNGDRTIIADNNTGSGPALEYVGGIALEPDGKLLVSNGTDDWQHILRVDPLTGDREIVPGSEGVFAISMSWTLDGKLVVSPYPIEINTIRLFDPATGEHSIITGPGIGTGPDFNLPLGVLVYVPEPSSLAITGIGLLGVIPWAARRRAARRTRLA